MKNNNVLMIILVAIIVGAGGFFTGTKYQQSKSPAASRQFAGGQGMRNGLGQGNRQGFRPVSGEIISADEKSVTVKLQDGSSKIVLFSSKMTINKAAEGTIADLKVGEKVSVFGTDNTDGSVTAQNIQLGQIFRGGPTPTVAN
ncbi:MAG: hypothetical protein NT078_00545 [Candidatus Azambacteria bacterium]|nr:hypothetical protein [Candidatus Azambacteria bacterium]